jgi:hypothetical protein
MTALLFCYNFTGRGHLIHFNSIQFLQVRLVGKKRGMSKEKRNVERKSISAISLISSRSSLSFISVVKDGGCSFLPKPNGAFMDS